MNWKGVSKIVAGSVCVCLCIVSKVKEIWIYIQWSHVFSSLMSTILSQEEGMYLTQVAWVALVYDHAIRSRWCAEDFIIWPVRRTKQDKTDLNEDSTMVLVMNHLVGLMDRWAHVNVDDRGHSGPQKRSTVEVVDVRKVAVWLPTTVWCRGRHTVKAAWCPGEAARSGSTWTMAM